MPFVKVVVKMKKRDLIIYPFIPDDILNDNDKITDFLKVRYSTFKAIDVEIFPEVIIQPPVIS